MQPQPVHMHFVGRVFYLQTHQIDLMNSAATILYNVKFRTVKMCIKMRNAIQPEHLHTFPFYIQFCPEPDIAQFVEME